MTEFLQVIVTSIALAGLYTALGLGFSLTWGLLRTINFAHLGFVFIAGYMTYTLSTDFGLDPFAALIPSAIVLSVLAVGLQYLVTKAKLNQFATLIVSFGILLVIESILGLIWTQDELRININNNPYATWILRFSGVTVPVSYVIGIVITLLLLIFVWWLLNKSRYGFAIRASVDEPQIARAFGINGPRLGYFIAIISGTSAAVAGVLIGINNSLTPTGANNWLAITMAVVLLGGMANPFGTAASAMLLAFAQTLTSQYSSPTLAQLVSIGVLTVVLLLRPQGLFKSIVEGNR